MSKEKIMILLGKLMVALNGTELLTEVTDALNELLKYKQIDNANSSEALECLDRIGAITKVYSIDLFSEFVEDLDTIRQYILKAQEQEKKNIEYKNKSE